MNALALVIERDEASLVDSIIEYMLKEKPNMYERYSDEGPARTREDVAYHLKHLVAALIAEDPEMFSDYYAWLLGVLLPRGILMEDIDINFRCMHQVLVERYGDDAAQAVHYLEQRNLAGSKAS